jgi:hypothetical protein
MRIGKWNCKGWDWDYGYCYNDLVLFGFVVGSYIRICGLNLCLLGMLGLLCWL